MFQLPIFAPTTPGETTTSLRNAIPFPRSDERAFICSCYIFKPKATSRCLPS